MQQVDSRRSTVLYSMAMPFSASHQHALGAMPRRASSKQAFVVWPYIEVPEMAGGPSRLTSLDRDPIRLRNTVRPDAALPPCRHYEHQNSTQVQRFHGVGPGLACIDSLTGDFRCQTRRRARARRAAELHQTTCRIDADARDAISAASQPDRLRLQPLQRTGSCSRLQAAAKRPPHQAAIRTLTGDVI